MIFTPLYFFLLIELIFVSYGDLKYRKISNLWSIVNLAFSLLLFVSYPKLYPFNLSTFQYTFVFIMVGFILFQLKIMGGGDSKYLATFFLLIPYKSQDEVFSYLLISTIFIGVMFFVNNVLKNYDKIMQSIVDKNLEGVKSCFGSKFPFAPVILVSWILVGWELKVFIF